MPFSENPTTSLEEFKIDPKIKLLRHSPRAINVLQKSRELSNWRKVSPSHYQGIAYGNYLNTIQAHIFEISIDLKNEIYIHKIFCKNLRMNTPCQMNYSSTFRIEK